MATYTQLLLLKCPSCHVHVAFYTPFEKNMLLFRQTLSLIAVGFLLSCSALGQTSEPTLQFESIFSRYQNYTEPAPERWQDANQKVHAIGGWRAYAQESNAPEPTQDAKHKAASGGQP